MLSIELSAVDKLNWNPIFSIRSTKYIPIHKNWLRNYTKVNMEYKIVKSVHMQNKICL